MCKFKFLGLYRSRKVSLILLSVSPDWNCCLFATKVVRIPYFLEEIFTTSNCYFLLTP